MLFSRPYPVPADEVSRVAELLNYHILDTPPEPVFDDLVSLTANVFGVQTCLISLVDNERQWFKAKFGLDACETPRTESFCSHAILSDEVMVIPDASIDPRFSENPLVIGPPFIRFYAGAPLVSHHNHNIGTLCVIDSAPREGLDVRDVEQLKRLAKVASEEVKRRYGAALDELHDFYEHLVEGIVQSYFIKPSSVSVVDVSRKGAIIRAPGIDLAKGEEVVLTIGQTAVVSTIAWTRGIVKGLTMHRDLGDDELRAIAEISDGQHSVNDADDDA